MKIYFIDSKEHTCFQELLEDGFNTSDGKFKATYFDPNYEEQECHQARRSFLDLLAICQTYYPDTTKEELAYHLLSNTKMNRFFCNDIRKIVFRIHERCSFDLSYDYKGVDDISFNDLEKYAADYKVIKT